MKLTFVSNYINHHQIPLAQRLYEELQEGYCFIQTMPMEAERANMGWSAELSELPYVKCFYEDEEGCKKIIEESDIVIFGGVEENEQSHGHRQNGIKEDPICKAHNDSAYQDYGPA